ncbi:MAG: oligosaccharide flippase family protein [Inconstantimicrobium porci]|uniref:oligosaccharide flippase family protein n=1 Tax=Inconstantimicrobium porci TaxID=2652291 RepID=UPI002A909C17|nr:oligosaccharide flippase family protein [Inconstantimicrobium porci]MDY5911577.1 oligosaccharide flippase family protein [Inconstantimicrobium porci]
MPKEKSIFKNTLYSIALRVFNLVVPIVVGAYPINIFGAGLMGTANYSETIYLYFMIFAGFGIYNYALREISRVRNNKKKVEQLFTSFFILTIITHLIVTAVYLIYTWTSFKGQFIYGVLLVYGFNMFQDIFYIEWINEALENYNFITIKSIIVRSIYVVLLLTLVKTKDDFMIYVWLNTFCLVANNLTSFIYIKKDFKFDFSKIEIKKHIKPLLFIMVIANATVLYTKLDELFLGWYGAGNYSAVSIYHVPQLMINIINPVILSIVAVTVPRLSNVIVEKGEEEYEKLLNKITTIYYMFLFPVGIGLSLYSKEVIALYTTSKYKEYIPAITVLQIFAIYLLVLGTQSIFTNQIMYVKKKENELFKFILVCGVLNFILKGILIKFGEFNPATAIGSTLISNFALIAMQYVFIRTKIKMNYNILEWSKIKYLIFSLIFIPVTMFIRSFDLGIIKTAIVGVTINAAIYMAILYFTRDKPFNLILSKILRKKK